MIVESMNNTIVRPAEIRAFRPVFSPLLPVAKSDCAETAQSAAACSASAGASMLGGSGPDWHPSWSSCRSVPSASERSSTLLGIRSPAATLPAVARVLSTHMPSWSPVGRCVPNLRLAAPQVDHGAPCNAAPMHTRLDVSTECAEQPPLPTHLDPTTPAPERAVHHAHVVPSRLLAPTPGAHAQSVARLPSLHLTASTSASGRVSKDFCIPTETPHGGIEKAHYS